MNVEFSGLREMVAKLESAGVNMRGAPMYEALGKGGNVIATAMIERAPMLEEHQPGSDQLEPGALRDDTRVAFEIIEGQPVALIGPGGKTAHAARWVEYGHRMVTGGYSKVLPSGLTRGPGQAGEDIPAYPYLRPAFEASVGEAVEVVSASLKESFKEILS
jgi:hypothetical protein